MCPTSPSVSLRKHVSSHHRAADCLTYSATPPAHKRRARRKVEEAKARERYDRYVKERAERHEREAKERAEAKRKAEEAEVRRKKAEEEYNKRKVRRDVWSLRVAEWLACTALALSLPLACRSAVRAGHSCSVIVLQTQQSAVQLFCRSNAQPACNSLSGLTACS